ncbi:MAG: RsmE family RNA methyltransferase [Melioribacter sp.]|uniref:RsmE family RNA methyltransferase n=1 Tax=Rosettibacter primus TaxID=3111523 RepID=UPI00247B5152|nr:RsmE family RNA methyltransferase [Melioribacter sp.]
MSKNKSLDNSTNNFFSDIELYYSTHLTDNEIFISGEELHHIKNVMRHKTGDEIFVTDGEGKIFRSRIEFLSKEAAKCLIKEKYLYENKFSNYVFCLPRLKNNDRIEFAIEKCVELGITNFLFFESERTIAKGFKVERIKKLLLSSMKQSLQAWLPKANFIKNITDLKNYEGDKILFEQKSEMLFKDFLIDKKNLLPNNKIYFIFGPEGGFSENEITKIQPTALLRITKNRLRSETAIITVASLLSTLIQ